ncbi:MAG: P-loop NTPase [Actinomycetota bacterium]
MNIVLATDDHDFESRLRRAADGIAGEVVRLGSDGTGLGDHIRAAGPDAIVVLGPGPEIDGLLASAERLDASGHGGRVVVAAERSADVLQGAMRVGVRDVVEPAASSAELREVVERLTEVARRHVGPMHHAPILDQRTVVVTAAKGGSGKSMFSTNLALALAEAAPGEVVLVDLDLQFGDIEHLMRLEPQTSMAEAARMGGRLDMTSIAAFLTRYRDLFVLAAPSSPALADDVVPDSVGRVLDLVAQRFRYVVVDTASGINEFALAALDRASDIVLLAATDIAAVRATQKTVEALSMLSMEDRRWHFVLNRANARVGITQAEIEAAIGLQAEAAIPSTKAVPVSFNDGTPLYVSDPRHPVSKAVASFASTLLPTVSGRRRRRWALVR